MPTVDLITLSWNRKDLTKAFVESFLKHTRVPCRLIIIDQASTDGSPDYLRALNDQGNCKVTVLLNSDNKGFVRGMNQGIAMSDADFVCLVNNDVLFSDGWLEEILAVFEQNEKIGVLNPNSNTLGLKLSEGQAIESVAKDLRDKYEGVFVEMPFCSGFCMIARKALIDKAGGLSDEYAPMFFEDSDFSKKALQAGYLIGFAKGSYVWHQEHGSFSSKDKDIENIFQRNKRIFEEKWGKILRVAWIVESAEELSENLAKGVELVRQGNFLTFYTRKVDVEREEIFKRKGLFEHSGLQFKRFSNYLILIFKIVFKKKKFDVIVSQNNFLKIIFKLLLPHVQFCEQAAKIGSEVSRALS